MTDLYDTQEYVSGRVFESVENIMLCGGTALARCYLNHRLSYDLDFFMRDRFDPVVLLRQLNEELGIPIVDAEIDNRDGIASQIHGETNIGKVPLKVSFIQDVFVGMFPDVWRQMGSTPVHTEDLDGLMHRKLRTLSGSGLGPDGRPMGGRTTARDLFDIYVLSTTYKPVWQFITDINGHGANFPVESYAAGVKSIDWISLIEDFEEMELIEPYSADVRAIRQEIERL